MWPCTDQKSGWVALSRRAFEIFETREDRKMWWHVHASAVSGKKAPWNMAHSACSLCLCCQCFAVKTWRLVFKWVEQFEHDMLNVIWIYLNIILIYTILYTVPVHISTTWSSLIIAVRSSEVYARRPLCATIAAWALRRRLRPCPLWPLWRLTCWKNHTWLTCAMLIYACRAGSHWIACSLLVKRSLSWSLEAS